MLINSGQRLLILMQTKSYGKWLQVFGVTMFSDGIIILQTETGKHVPYILLGL